VNWSGPIGPCRLANSPPPRRRCPLRLRAPQPWFELVDSDRSCCDCHCLERSRKRPVVPSRMRTTATATKDEDPHARAGRTTWGLKFDRSDDRPRDIDAGLATAEPRSGKSTLSAISAKAERGECERQAPSRSAGSQGRPRRGGHAAPMTIARRMDMRARRPALPGLNATCPRTSPEQRQLSTNSGDDWTDRKMTPYTTAVVASCSRVAREHRHRDD